MRLYLDSIVGLLQERSAEELIVGVFLALLLAVAVAGVYSLARHKMQDKVVLLAVVGLIANLILMTCTASYIRMNLRSHFPRTPNNLMGRSTLNRSQNREPAFDATARAIFQEADRDGDGKLSADEAAAASARFVELAQAEAGKPLDRGALAVAIEKRVQVFEKSSPIRGHAPSTPPGPDVESQRSLSGENPGPNPQPSRM